MSIRAKHVFFGVFALLTVFVFYVYETPFLDPHSPVWARVEPVKWLMLPHAVAGAVALLVHAIVPGYAFIIAGALSGAIAGALTE